MLFHSQFFLIAFLPVVLALYYLSARLPVARKSILILASLCFYGAWDILLLPVLIGSIIANIVIARFISVTGVRGAVVAGIAVNLLLLGVFKYADFAADTVLTLVGLSHEPWALALPLGISFFTFQQVSYLADLHRGRARVYGILDYTLYVSFFPQLVAGPIVRHDELIPQFVLDPLRPGVAERLARGGVLLTIGLVKKIAIADRLAAAADPVFAAVHEHSSLGAGDAWLGALAFGFQIYFDFSAYSDMAIGLALMMGFSLPANFNAPYRAPSISEFWRRWHMTLSRFLRDYLYIPLGGSRHGPLVQAIALMVTMVLGGLWHGAAWTFVAWGALHGAALGLCHIWRRYLPSPGAALGWLATISFVFLTWVLFRAESFSDAVSILGAMMDVGTITSVSPRLLPEPAELISVLILAMLISTLGPTSQVFAGERLRPRVWSAVVSGLALAVAILAMGGGESREFIYFEF